MAHGTFLINIALVELNNLSQDYLFMLLKYSVGTHTVHGTRYTYIKTSQKYLKTADLCRIQTQAFSALIDIFHDILARLPRPEGRNRCKFLLIYKSIH